MMKTVDRVCELCHAQASLYCQSDAAFLCWSCDSNVHQANFLVARHVRRIICSKCKAFTGNPVFDYCASCSLASSQNDHLDSLSSSSYSDCLSSTLSCTTSQKKTHSDRRKISRFNSSNSLNCLSSSGYGKVASSQRRSRRGGGTTSSIMDLKAEGVLVYWCRRLELTGDRAVRLGRNALRFCWDQMTVLPFRVSLAGALWFGLRNCGDRSLYTRQTLTRLEEISGVQAKLISAAESKLERALKVVATRRSIRQRNHRLQLEEGWAESECSS